MLRVDIHNVANEGFFVSTIVEKDGAMLDPILRNQRYAMMYTFKNFIKTIIDSEKSDDE